MKGEIARAATSRSSATSLERTTHSLADRPRCCAIPDRRNTPGLVTTHAQTMNDKDSKDSKDSWCIVEVSEASEASEASKALDVTDAPDVYEAPAGVAVRASDTGLDYAIKVSKKHQSESGRKPLDIEVLFCFDVSSSMQGAGIKAIQDMIRTMPHTAKELTHNTFFGTVAVFSSKCHVLPCAKHSEKISDWTPQKTQEIIDKLFAMGMTNFDEALRVSTDHALKSRGKADACIILLATDGEVSTGDIRDAESLRTRFISDRENRPVYIAPIAIGPMPNAAYLTTLASNESFLSFAKGAEEASGAVLKALKAFDEAQSVFDVTVSIKRVGNADSDKEHYTTNFGFLTDTHNTVTGTLDYNLKAGDQVELTFPGGEHSFLVGNEVETSRADIWQEVDANRRFEAILEGVNEHTQKMTLHDTAEAIKKQMDSIPVHRSLSVRVDTVVEALLAQPVPVVGKRMSAHGCRSLDDDQDDEYEGTLNAPMFRSIGESFRSLSADQHPYSYNSRDLAWAAIKTRSAF